MIVQQLAVGPMQNFSYLLGDPETKSGAIIDPGWEPETLLQQLKYAGLNVEYILLTHTHFDHVGALDALHRQSDVPIYVHENEAGAVQKLGAIVNTTRDGDTLMIGSLKVRCLHTPGHSPGGQCFLMGNHCFTGDSLFIDGCGRVDLDGSDPQAMYTSLQKIAALPDDTIVYPGHDYGPTPTSTIGEQLKSNVYLQSRSKDEFFVHRGVS